MRIIARTLFGLEDVLFEELVSLGAGKPEKANRAVVFEGDMNLLYRVNYVCRTALAFLMPVAEFSIAGKEDLYRECLKINWMKYLDVDSTFSVIPVVNSPLFTHTGYPGLVVKDAVADYFRKRSGKRPSVSSVDPAIVINLHISNRKVTVSLDSTVVPLFKRGYRVSGTVAPLNEVLAAGIIRIAGWDGMKPFVDPMCGSGTISVEAALAACRIPAGKFRNFFGFQKWRNYDNALFEEIKRSEDSKIVLTDVNISASDISAEAIAAAGENIGRAGLSGIIRLKEYDFRDLENPYDEAVIIINPPYGQRITSDDMDSLYSMIGSTLKHRFSGSSAWVISSDREALKKVGLKASGKYILFNGALECQLVNYELYQGSKKGAVP